MSTWIRNLVVGALALVAAACSPPANPDQPPVDMGNFRLGFNVVVVDNPTVGPFSRKASDEEWKQALTAAVDRRFGGYEGDKLYHIGIKLDAYVLAKPGVPVVFTPRSVLVMTVNIWDDAAQKRLNTKEKAFSIFEGASGKSLIGTGFFMGRKAQMELLANNAAKAIQDWILEHPEWVGLPPHDSAEAPAGPDAAANGN